MWTIRSISTGFDGVGDTCGELAGVLVGTRGGVVEEVVDRADVVAEALVDGEDEGGVDVGGVGGGLIPGGGDAAELVESKASGWGRRRLPSGSGRRP
jgi:hypothetical protein